MIICVDFDGTVVNQVQVDDLDTPLTFIEGAREALAKLKEAGHVLFLWSARSNLALREDWRLNPLWVTGAVPVDLTWWKKHKPLAEARYQQMVKFVEAELPGIFDAVDDGRQGKPAVADLFVDDRTLGWAYTGWDDVVELYG